MNIINLIVMTTLLAGCATAKTINETKAALPIVFKLVEEKNMAEALNQLKAIGHCESSAIIGSGCGAWKIAYELKGEPVEYRTKDERGGASPNTVGDEKLKQLIRLMSSIHECSKFDEKSKMEECLEPKVVDRTFYTQGTKERFSQFKSFVCTNNQSVKAGGWSHSNNTYSASEAFIFKSDAGSSWASIKKIVASEMCNAHKLGAKQ